MKRKTFVKQLIALGVKRTDRWKAKRSKKMPQERMGAETGWTQ